jgi:CDP-paratose 2-epimerase
VNTSERAVPAEPIRVLITGGAGFIGTNLACRLVQHGAEVCILDSLARAGSEDNVRWLSEQFPDRIEFVNGDVRDAALLQSLVANVDHIYHLAAQVAVTTSLVRPLDDFEVNALGTLNLLEAMRDCARPPSLVFTSTNKVYGALEDVEVQPLQERYVPVDDHVRTSGIDESRQLDFHSPYGCSKGAADQYVLDYSRSFGLRTAVLRMSCIYGPHQHGNEDQGWVAHFIRCALAGTPVTVYGDGMQVRDVLFVSDLIDAFEAARARIEVLQGHAFNIGGGTSHTLSILELIDQIQRMTGVVMDVSFAHRRVGDQRYYVSNIARFRQATGWHPRTAVAAGLSALTNWYESTAPRAFNRPQQSGKSAHVMGVQ